MSDESSIIVYVKLRLIEICSNSILIQENHYLLDKIERLSISFIFFSNLTKSIYLNFYQFEKELIWNHKQINNIK